MNALLVDHQHVLYDAFDGVNDLHNGKVRFIGDPATRITEDYLRLYRYFRFWGRFGKGPADISALPSLMTIKNDLSQLSVERVQSELFKILTLPWPGTVLTSMMDYGLLNHVFCNKIDYADGIKALRHLVMFERFGKHPPCAIRRLCALTQGQNVSDILKFSRAHKKKCDTLNKVITDPHYEIALTHPEWWVDSMLLKGARSADPVWACRGQAKTLTPPPAFPLTGADVMAKGITDAKIGEVLTDVKRQWIASGFTLDRDGCLKYLIYI
jgi:tRNA nucleotidyltransferase/poly(A) polymerase